MYVNIQFLRFIAASMVVLFHATPVFLQDKENVFSQLIHLTGFSGVDIFFVISGFIIWHTTESIQGKIDTLNFIFKRFTRIFSGYWPFLIFAILLIIFFGKGDFSNKNIFGSIFLFPVPISERILPISWTLTYELYFYISFSFLLFLPLSQRKLILIVVFILICVINFIGTLFFEFYSKAFFTTTPLYLRIPFSPYNLEFLGGALIAAFNSRSHHENKTILYLMFYICFLILGILYNQNFVDAEIDKGFYVVERVIFFGLSAIFILLFMLSLEQKNTVILTSLSIQLGGASYSIYLSHVLIIELLSRIYSTKSVWLILMTFLSVTLYSLLHYKFIEKPIYIHMKKSYKNFFQYYR